MSFNSMVPEKYRLEAIGRFLIAAYERRRPGFSAWTPQLEQELLEESRAELARMEAQCKELGVDDSKYWERARGLLTSVLLPRYAVLAKEEMALAKTGYHLWRNGDVIARGAFAAAGLVLGAAAVAIPWIPVTEKWIPWTLFVAGPLIPDMQFWFYKKRYQRRLNALVVDLKNAGESDDAYRSIAEMQQALGVPGDAISIEPPAPVEMSAPEPVSADPGSTDLEDSEPQIRGAGSASRLKH